MSDDATQIDRKKLFIIGVLALFTAAMSASLRAAVGADIKTELLDPISVMSSGEMIGQALGAAFLGFAFTLFVASPFLDTVGMRRMLYIAGGAFIGGIGLTISAGALGTGDTVFDLIWLGMFLNGVAWGAVEATINPMTTALYPEDKTHRLNVIHAWWPGGLIVGGLLGWGLGDLNLPWQIMLGLALIPAIAFLVMCIGTTFPQTERAEAGISMKDMMMEIVRRPSFLIWFVAMFLTAASELAPGQWVDLALSQKVGMRGILLLVYVSGLMFVMRHFAGVLAHRMNNAALLWFSSLLAGIGLFLLSRADGPVSAMLAATVWGMGVCFMWPTMLATIAERYPKGGSWLIGLLGSAGALSIYFVLPELGKLYDAKKLELAGGEAGLAALPAEAMIQIEGAAAAHSFEVVSYIPIALLVIFGGIWLYDRRRGAEPIETLKQDA